MADWISSQLEDIPIWGLGLGMIAGFALLYLLLSYFNIRVDGWQLPLGLHKLLNPLGITLLTAGGVVGGVIFGLIREQVA